MHFVVRANTLQLAVSNKALEVTLANPKRRTCVCYKYERSEIGLWKSELTIVA
jgi:hypothetical protein